MKTFNSLKCAAVMLPALAVGVPMAHANEEERKDPRQGTAQNQYLENMPTQGYHSENLIGQEVKSRHNDETIGTISKLLMDENDQIVAAVISVGGFLGIGDRDVAIAWNQIERRDEGDETTLWVNLTEDSLRDAPEFSDETGFTRRDQQRTGQRADQRDEQRIGQRQRDDQRDDQRIGQRQRDDQRADQSIGQRDDERAAHGRTAQYLETKPAHGFHSDKVIGQEVKSRTTDETIGTVSNLLLDNEGQVVAVVVGVGGLLGIGERDVAIAWDQVERRMDDDDDVTLWVDLTEEHLRDAPQYESERQRTRSRR